MTLFIWVQFTWDLQSLNQLELYSILALNIWLSPVPCVMIRLQEISNSKNTIHFLAHLFKETNLAKDAALLHTICINLTPTKFFLKLPLS